MSQLINWEEKKSEKHSSLYRDFEFKNFIEAWGFMSQVAILAERANHHPQWKNIYNKVSVELTTHDEGNTITQKDRDLAMEINELLE